MYVGDSLTHGISTSSWRYDLSKIFIDNGIDFNAIGVWSGNSGYNAVLSYGGVTFDNDHSACASMRALQVSGDNRLSYRSVLDGSGIQQWLGVGSYSGSTPMCSDVPDTMFVMLGTNDLLSQGRSDADSVTILVEDIQSIVGYGQESNPNLTTYIMSIPVWYKDTSTSSVTNSAFIDAVNSYNEKIAAWADETDNVTFIDINSGIFDVTKSETTTMGQGVTSFFISDGLHLSNQGNLIFAGNLAKGMGIAGRSAGQERKAASDLAIQFDASQWTLTGVTESNGALTFGTTGSDAKTATYSWTSSPTGGFTLDFKVAFGNGSEGGWDTDNNLSVYLGTSNHYGLLNINEAYLQWGDTVLYSTDTSKLSDSLRVAYVLGDSSQGLSAGYYVWLDDQLIGEALSATCTPFYDGVTFSYSGTGEVVVSNITLDNTGSYAPTTTGTLDASNALRIEGTETVSTGTIAWIDETQYETTTVNNELTIDASNAVGVASNMGNTETVTSNIINWE
jgi:lysophospholipase L1-like esterase